MSEVKLAPGWFRIADLADTPALRDDLFALEERQTRELIVDGVRGRWERTGGWTMEHALMAPTHRTREMISDLSADGHTPRVAKPNDALDEEAFFTPGAPFPNATADQRREAGRKLLALATLGWRSTSRWYGDRDELHER